MCLRLLEHPVQSVVLKYVQIRDPPEITYHKKRTNKNILRETKDSRRYHRVLSSFPLF